MSPKISANYFQFGARLLDIRKSKEVSDSLWINNILLAR